ncbi:hypothetical protein QVN96_14905 [Mediterraneibacter glycyrrhizinilyticus]|jgi:hypothetical protein|uniref:hypothetical protein n=1 Tax=Mediterraneibacter glycyrrhizinilyticus TaxID=342942 RepID=UPI0025AB0CA5|nr:hypothetical protein [Mediterraneibacter glycyrrhizinilyticus]MDN0062670.1 hypothetical protein [Mediterraneibacter glycyrrhizinilyticus]
MSIFEYDQEKHMRQEREDAWKDGLLEGKASAVISLLENLGALSEKLEQKIKSETDPDILDKWIRLAAKAESLAEFEEEM